MRGLSPLSIVGEVRSPYPVPPAEKPLSGGGVEIAKRFGLAKRLAFPLALALALGLAGGEVAYAVSPPAEETLQPGDILFVKDGRSYNPIGGYWNHCALYVGYVDEIGYAVVEAIEAGVVYTKVEDFYGVADRTRIEIQRLSREGRRWWNGNSLREQVLEAAVSYAKWQVGKPYDQDFNKYDDEAHYCSELVWHSYYDGLREAGLKPINLDSNRATEVRPDDLWNSRRLECLTLNGPSDRS